MVDRVANVGRDGENDPRWSQQTTDEVLIGFMRRRCMFSAEDGSCRKGGQFKGEGRGIDGVDRNTLTNQHARHT